ncbi:MAG: iron-sulfur cluster assembly accessory protein [Pseudomonadota bacterium]
MTTNDYSTQISEADMRLTPAAQAKFTEILKEADAEAAGIRVFVSGGGCGGMTYGMTYADAAADKAFDSVLEGQGFKIFVDPIALNFLQGCEVDFKNSNFVFNNVFKAVGGSGTCGGCGGGGF